MPGQSSSSKATSRLPEHGLPKAELDALACLVRRQQATARELREAIHGFRPMTHGSMVTLLNRLEARGLVTHGKGSFGKAFVHRATGRTEPVYRRLIKDLVARIFGGSGVAMVTALFQAKPPSREEIDQIQSLIDEHRTKSKRSRRA